MQFIKRYGYIILITVVVVSVLFLLLYLVFWGENIEKQDAIKNNPVSVDDPSDDQIIAPTITEASNLLSSSFLQSVCELTPDRCTENFFFSPIGIHSAFSMLEAGTHGDTRDQLVKALFTDRSNDAITAAQYKSLINSLNRSGDGYEMVMANSLWLNSNRTSTVSPSQQYIDILTENYMAEIDSLSFTDLQSVAVINGWASQKTNGKINKIFESLSDDSYLILMNAIYLKADWKYEFDKDRTEKEDFTLSNGKRVSVEMMRSSKLSLNYYSDDTWKAIELPYKDENVSSWLFMPSDSDDLEKFDYTLFKQVLADISSGEAYVKLPKFEIRNEIDLKAYMQRLGVVDAFDSEKADLTGIASADLFVSGAKQVSYLKVDEEGSEAAAVTAITVGTTSVSVDETKPFEFYADKPFIYTLYDKANGLILFMGLINNPSEG